MTSTGWGQNVWGLSFIICGNEGYIDWFAVNTRFMWDLRFELMDLLRRPLSFTKQISRNITEALSCFGGISMRTKQSAQTVEKKMWRRFINHSRC
jgi:hypothetical protein